MKLFTIIIFLFYNLLVNAETLYYEKTNTAEEDAVLMQVEFPKDCPKIVEINKDKSLQFTSNDKIEKIISECNSFLKGKKIRETVKSGSNKILNTGVKVKEGIQKGLKSSSKNITNSVSEETSLIIEDTVKLKDGIVDGTSKVINSTLETGNKITSGVSSFFKGIFGPEN